MLKIGALSFINALPFFCPFIDRRVQLPCEFSYGTPTKINNLLETGAIDIGLISSANFIANRDKYILLTNLGIGATQCVKSVCLYSKKEISKLDNKIVAIPDASATSVMLLRVLCEHVWKIKPKFVLYTSNTPLPELLKIHDAALVIGDECLLAKTTPEIITIDLCEAWYKFSMKPFVFAVFATRLDSWMDFPDEVREFHQKLFLAYDHSSAHFDDVLNMAREKTGLSIDTLKEYYNVLDYYLDSAHFQGLEHFAKLKS